DVTAPKPPISGYRVAPPPADVGRHPQADQSMPQRSFPAHPAAGSSLVSAPLCSPVPAPRLASRRIMRRGLVPVGACVLALLNPDLLAQSSDALPPDAIQLSPFTVSTEKDKGYRATNSVAGTRLSTEIKKVPMSIEVITNDFIRDTGSTSLRESLRYSSGIILSSQQDGLVNPGALDNGANAGANDPRGVNRDPNDTTLKIRGFVVDQVLRDGFRRQTASDSVNIERIEVVRGPSALLYGVGSFGGVVNYLPKEPQLDPSYDIEFGVGSWDFKRASLDFTGPLGAP